MSKASQSNQSLIYAFASIAGLILLLVWMQGGFSSKVGPGNAEAAESAPPKGTPFKVVATDHPQLRQWPATVSARTVAQIAPKITARILDIKVRPGDAVKAGQVLAHLDEKELRARLNQSRSALAAAEAEASRAAADARRIKNLFDKEAATQQSLDAAKAAAGATGANAQSARAAIAEAEALLGETGLRAPFDGVVVQRHLEPGDLAAPSTPVLTVQTTQRLRIEAAIPQSCGALLRPGDALKARLGDDTVDATVEEVAPAADPQTRTVLVKAGIAGSARPGGFAWIEQDCGEAEVLLIPAAAVSRSGQLESVQLLQDGRALLRHVRSGKRHDDMIEILSGLKSGDTILVGSRP